ncbi:MAG: HAD family phosphatase [Acidobacteriota bacterium]|nr:HAD family phosphatase [Acidobacteriota bacterium]
MKFPRALVFDMDGLMIDSERLYVAAEREIAASFGRTVSDETLGKMMGRKPVESLEIYVREAGLPISAEEAFEIRSGIMRRKLGEDLRPMPGLDRILARFRGRLKLAVATGAQAEFLRIAISGLRLEGAFDVLQDSDGIATGKPDPDIFLAACRRLELPPASCVVLEDSQNGVAAGRRAGCYVIAVPNEYTRSHDFSPADFVAAGLDGASEHIESLLEAADGGVPRLRPGQQ